MLHALQTSTSFFGLLSNWYLSGSLLAHCLEAFASDPFLQPCLVWLNWANPNRFFQSSKWRVLKEWFIFIHANETLLDFECLNCQFIVHMKHTCQASRCGEAAELVIPEIACWSCIPGTKFGCHRNIQVVADLIHCWFFIPIFSKKPQDAPCSTQDSQIWSGLVHPLPTNGSHSLSIDSDLGPLAVVWTLEASGWRFLWLDSPWCPFTAPKTDLHGCFAKIVSFPPKSSILIGKTPL